MGRQHQRLNRLEQEGTFGLQYERVQWFMSLLQNWPDELMVFLDHEDTDRERIRQECFALASEVAAGAIEPDVLKITLLLPEPALRGLEELAERVVLGESGDAIA